MALYHDGLYDPRDFPGRRQPDAIVSPYLLYQAPLAAVFTLSQRSIPLLTVVTDLATVHRLWFYKVVDLCLVSMPEVRDQALESGLSPEQVVVTGIPVHPNLAHPDKEPAAIRAELVLQPGLTTGLVVGSKRVKNLPGILRALNHSGLPLQLIAVAGGDEKLYQEFQATEWHIPARVFNAFQALSKNGGRDHTRQARLPQTERSFPTSSLSR